jgi:hypothetical protein
MADKKSKSTMTRGDKKAQKSRLDEIMSQMPTYIKPKPGAKKVGDK